MASTPAGAQTIDDGQREIRQLIEQVAQSGCRFERNGQSYDAEQAAGHLRMKLQRAGARIQSAEQFIEQIASKSYLSGAPYYMRCPSEAQQPTGQWFNHRLQALRQAPADGSRRK